MDANEMIRRTRWQNGWGFQLRHEVFNSDILFDGDSEISNTFDRNKSINKTWLEGIYTFRREVRLTLILEVPENIRKPMNCSIVQANCFGPGDTQVTNQSRRN